jgi:hypothetical protein
MVTVRRSIVAIFFVCLVTASSAFGSAANIYITQNGSPSGNCTTNVQTPAFFNNAANWGSGASQIGPGTTVLICGTFTLPAGGTGFQFQGSGANGSPITFRFDTGAVIQAPYFAGSDAGSPTGAISINGHNYSTIDGNNSGIIKATANGSNLANHQAGLGIYAQGDHILIKNLTVQGIYVNGSDEPDSWSLGQYTDDILIDTGSTNVEICNSILNDSRSGIGLRVSGGSALGGPATCTDTQAASGLNVYNNTLDDHGWFMPISGTATINIYNNFLGPTWWVYPGCGNSGTPCSNPSVAYHTDGIFPGFGGITTAYIYNNYITGDNEGYLTGNIYCASIQNNTNGSTCTIFNNVLVRTSTNYYGGTGIAFDPEKGGDQQVYDNTVIGFDNDIYCCYTNYSGHITLYNNIFSSNGSYTDDGGGNTVAITSPATCSTIAASNGNLYYNERVGGGFSCNKVYYTFSTWKSSRGFDLQGAEVPYSTTNAITALNLKSDYTPMSSSPVMGLGINLANLEMQPLNFGAPLAFGANGSCGSGGCGSRIPNWNAGAYEADSGSIAPPTNLTVTAK